MKLPVVFLDPEDGKMRPKHVRPYDCLIIKQTDTFDKTFIHILIYYNIDVVFDYGNIFISYRHWYKRYADQGTDSLFTNPPDENLLLKLRAKYFNFHLIEERNQLHLPSHYLNNRGFHQLSIQ